MSPFKQFIVVFIAGLVGLGYWFIPITPAPVTLSRKGWPPQIWGNTTPLSDPPTLDQNPWNPLSFMDVGSWMFGPTSTVSIPALWKGKCRPLRDDDLTHFLLDDTKVDTTAFARGKSKPWKSYKYVYVFSNWCIQTFGHMHPAVRWADNRTANIPSQISLRTDTGARISINLHQHPPIPGQFNDNPSLCQNGILGAIAYVFPIVDYRMNNMGHVMVRMYSIYAFLQKLPKGEAERITAIFMITSSMHNETENTFLRQGLYQPLFSGRVLSVVGIAPNTLFSTPNSVMPLKRLETMPRLSMCFEKVYVGWSWVLGVNNDKLQVAAVKGYRDLFLEYHSITRRQQMWSPRQDKVVRVHILNRRRTRRFIGVENLVKQLQNHSDSIFEVKLVEFDSLTVKEQVEIIASTDVFVGILGASTCQPAIFLPTGAVLVQIFSGRIPWKWVNPGMGKKKGWYLEAKQAAEAAGARYMAHQVSLEETVVTKPTDVMKDDIKLNFVSVLALIKTAIGKVLPVPITPVPVTALTRTGRRSKKKV